MKRAHREVANLYSGASLDADKRRDQLKAALAALDAANQEAAKERDKKASVEAEMQNLLDDVTAACDTCLPRG